MKSLCAANSGAVLVSVACSVSLVFAPLTALKASLARSSNCARALHRNDRVGEGRRRRIVGDREHFALLLRHAGEQRGEIIAVLDLARNRASGAAGCSASRTDWMPAGVAEAAACGFAGAARPVRRRRPSRLRRTRAEVYGSYFSPGFQSLNGIYSAACPATERLSPRQRPPRALRPHSAPASFGQRRSLCRAQRGWPDARRRSREASNRGRSRKPERWPPRRGSAASRAGHRTADRPARSRPRRARLRLGRDGDRQALARP